MDLLSILGLPSAWAILVISFVVFILTLENKKSLFLKKIPGPPRYPFVGAALTFRLANEEFYPFQFELIKRYGERIVLYSAYHYFMVLVNPDDVEKLLTSTVHINKGTTYKLLKSWLGEGLLTSHGKKWHTHRKLLTPSFHFKILEDFMVVFNEQSNIFVETLRRDFSNGEERDIFGYVTRCTLDIIGESIMGIKFNAQGDVSSEYLRAVNDVCEVLLRRSTRPQLWISFIHDNTPSGRKYRSALKTLHDFTDQVVKQRKKLREAQAKKVSKGIGDEDEIYWGGKRRVAFLDLLLDTQAKHENELSDLDIREEVDTFMFEGHDTTSASLNWTTFLLGCHPEYQVKVHEELDRIFGEDRTRPITSKDLTEMKYLEMCIKEALRLFPSVPFVSRNLESDLVLDEKITIPAGYDVLVFTMPIHRNEKYYPEPKKFNPERFLPENCANRHPFAYIPFSAGPRNCIGQKFALMEEKVVLANLFRNFKVEAAEALENVVVMLEVVTRPRDGLRVRLLPRMSEASPL